MTEIAKCFKAPGQKNPVMTQDFGADPYAMVYNDRVYLYMTADAFTYDEKGELTENTYGSIRSIHIISTSDMANFTDHGKVRAAGKDGAAKWASNSWAPAAAWKMIDGKPKFFLYFADAGGGIGVLTADDPAGPFTDPIGKPLISRQTPTCAEVLWLFDPAVLTDDDGRSYIYFGGGVPEGCAADPGTARVAELGEDMISLKGEPKRINPPYLFEDSGIHKAAGRYFYTYCSNFSVDEAGQEKYGFVNGEIISMESQSPMGPFVLKEKILQNPEATFGVGGNNHHCVFRFRNQWYIAYHTRVLERDMGILKGYRSTNIDAFEMGEDGSIGVIPQTLFDRKQIAPVDPRGENQAVTVSAMAGTDVVGADARSRAEGCGHMALGRIHTGDFVEIQGVDFGAETPSQFEAKVRNADGKAGVVRVCLDAPDAVALAALSVPGSRQEEFAALTTDLLGDVTGIHTLYLVFEGEGFELESWSFK